MAPKEPTKHQLSSRLTYSQNTPAFLRKLQSRVAGVPGEDSDENPEFEDDGSGRPPIPRRPPIPVRPASDPGSGEEDGGDEAPQVVVLKEGKHLSAWEVENEKRKGKANKGTARIHSRHPRKCQFIPLCYPLQAKGLPLLPDPSAATATTPSSDAKNPKTKKPEAKEKKTLSFSSSGPSSLSRPSTAKRKAVGVGDGPGDSEKEGDDDDGRSISRVRGRGPASTKVKTKKKPRVGLSFADDA